MLSKTSNEFRAFFLLQFTKELIENLIPKEVLELKKVLKEEAEKKKQEFKLPPKPSRKLAGTRKRILIVPRTKLPKHLQYLKPTPTSRVEISLEKLDHLIKDPMVRDIECNGPDQNIVVKGVLGVKKTNIVLTREEIDEIIKTFSETAKIPIEEGLFKVVVGRLVFSAIISSLTGSRFIIRKMTYSPSFRI